MTVNSLFNTLYSGLINPAHLWTQLSSFISFSHFSTFFNFHSSCLISSQIFSASERLQPVMINLTLRPARAVLRAQTCVHPYRMYSSIDSTIENLLGGSKKPHRSAAPTETNSPTTKNRFSDMFQKPTRPNTPQKSGNKKKPHSKAPRGKNQRGVANNRQNRPVEFELSAATDAAKDAMEFIIESIRKLNRGNYTVRYVDPQSNNSITTIELQELVNSMDLRKKGLMLIPGSADEGERPLVRQIEVLQMVQAYSEVKAKLKQQELGSIGLRSFERANQRREKAEKKKSATSQISIRWDISFHDLSNQKQREIEKASSKGETFLVIVGERKRSNTNTNALSFDEQSFDLSVELIEDPIVAQRHLKVFEALQEQLLLVGKVELLGSLAERLIFKVSSVKAPVVSSNTSNKNVQSDTSELLAKELRRLKRIEKLKPKKKVLEEDLDQMYDLKL